MERARLQRTAEYKSEISVQQEPVPLEIPVKHEPVTAPAPKQPAIFEIREEPSKPKPAAKPQVKEKYDRVGKLLENGMESQEIASVTGMSMGEIELIKNLKKR